MKHVVAVLLLRYLLPLVVSVTCAYIAFLLTHSFVISNCCLAGFWAGWMVGRIRR